MCQSTSADINDLSADRGIATAARHINIETLDVMRSQQTMGDVRLHDGNRDIFSPIDTPRRWLRLARYVRPGHIMAGARGYLGNADNMGIVIGGRARGVIT